MKIILFVIHSSSLPLASHQSRNIRIKKRGTISSAWLEKYKPKLPVDTDHCVSHSNSLRESNSESENIHRDEEMSTTEEKKNACNTLSITGKSESSYSNENDKETSQNSFNVVGRNTKMKSPDSKSKANNLMSAVDGSCKRDETVITYKCNEREDEKYTTEELDLKVSDAEESTRKSCANGSDFVSVSKPIMSNGLGEDAESASVEDSRDPPLEITRNKRKAGRDTTEVEKPRKKLRCESDIDEEVCEESKE